MKSTVRYAYGAAEVRALTKQMKHVIATQRNRNILEKMQQDNITGYKEK